MPATDTPSAAAGLFSDLAFRRAAGDWPGAAAVDYVKAGNPLRTVITQPVVRPVSDAPPVSTLPPHGGPSGVPVGSAGGVSTVDGSDGVPAPATVAPVLAFGSTQGSGGASPVAGVMLAIGAGVIGFYLWDKAKKKGAQK